MALIQYSDRALERKICQEENIQKLESIIDEELYTYNKLKFLNEEGKLNFREEIKPNDLQKTLTEVKTHVDSFLGTEDTSSCEISYRSLKNKHYLLDRILDISPRIIITAIASIAAGVAAYYIYPEIPFSAYTATIFIGGTALQAKKIFSLPEKEKNAIYDSNQKFIRLEKKPRPIIIPQIAHEYTHHVLNEKGLPVHKGYNASHEGMARLVQQHTAYLYAEKEKNPAFLYETNTQVLTELIIAYQHICKTLCIPQKYNSPKSDFTNYDLGSAYFYIEECNNGTEIYKDIIKSIG